MPMFIFFLISMSITLMHIIAIVMNAKFINTPSFKSSMFLNAVAATIFLIGFVFNDKLLWIKQMSFLDIFTYVIIVNLYFQIIEKVKK